MGGTNKSSLQKDEKFRKWYEGYRNSPEWHAKSSGRALLTDSPIDIVLMSGPVKASAKAAGQLSNYITKRALTSDSFDAASPILNSILKTYSVGAVPTYSTMKTARWLEDNSKPKEKYGIGGMLSTLLPMAGGIASTIDGMDGKSSMAGGVASGALSGAGALSFLGPLGIAAGAVGGGALSYLMEQKLQKEKERQEREARELQLKQLKQVDEGNSQAILAQYPTKGVSSSGFYRKGGSVQPSYQVENGEVLFADDRMPPVTDQFGSAKQIAPNTFKFQGVTHKHKSGGIGVRGGDTPYTDSYGQTHRSGFVLSDKLTTNASKYLKNI